jgi:hypothetical protein
MPYIGLALGGSTVVGVVGGLIISDAIKNSDASATGLVIGGWCYFAVTAWKVMHLGHYGRGMCFLPLLSFDHLPVAVLFIVLPERKIQAKWGALQNPSMMTSGQKWVGSKWEELADTTDPKVTHLLDHIFSAKNVVLNPTNDIGLEVANILRKAHEKFETLPKECLLRTAFPQAGSMFTTLLDLWSQESIILPPSHSPTPLPSFKLLSLIHSHK